MKEVHNRRHLVGVKSGPDSPRPLTDEGTHSNISYERHADHAFSVVRALLLNSAAFSAFANEYTRFSETGLTWKQGERKTTDKKPQRIRILSKEYYGICHYDEIKVVRGQL